MVSWDATSYTKCVFFDRESFSRCLALVSDKAAVSTPPAGALSSEVSSIRARARSLAAAKQAPGSLTSMALLFCIADSLLGTYESSAISVMRSDRNNLLFLVIFPKKAVLSN